MFIEVRGTEAMLGEIRLRFEDELQSAGYSQGPSLGSMETGTVLSYIKEETIVSLNETEESESGECTLRIEAETEVPELYKCWDAALIAYGKNVKNQLLQYAHDKESVDQGLK